MTPAPSISPVRRPRRFRAPSARRVVLTPADEEIIRYVFLLGYVPAQALYLFARVFRRSYSRAHDLGLGGLPKRCTELFHAGILARFDPRFSQYVRGPRFFVYCIESGRATELARAGKHVDQLTEDEWEMMRASSAPTRATLLALLIRLGFTPEFAEARLDATTRSACKFVSGATSLVPHTLLASTWLSIVWFGFLTRGSEIDPILPDSVADLSFQRCTESACGPRCRTPRAHTPARVAIEPDCLFAVNGLAVALEAETGQAARGKIEEKVERYLAFVQAHTLADIAARLGCERIERFVCVFHCASGIHAARIAGVIARRCPDGSDLFRITVADDFTFERTPDGVPLRREDFVRNAVLGGGERLYDVFAARINEPVFACVDGRRRDGSAIVRGERLA